MSTPIKSPWHPVSELPRRGTEIIVAGGRRPICRDMYNGVFCHGRTHWTTPAELLAACPLPEPETYEDKVRREFERYATTDTHLDLTRLPSGDYAAQNTFAAWLAYQAGATLNAGGAV